jgi:hypothetical protein
VADKTIKSAPEIIKEFIDGLETDPSLDKDTVEVIKQLHLTNKLTHTRLQQVLEANKKDMEKHG